MKIVIAAEKRSLATLLSEHVSHRVSPADIRVSENPDETGSFLVGFNLEHYVVTPSGEVYEDAID